MQARDESALRADIIAVLVVAGQRQPGGSWAKNSGGHGHAIRAPS